MLDRLEPPLGHVPPPLPAQWDGPHVAVKLAEAFVTLLRMPAATRPAGFKNSWPAYRHDWADLLAQVEGELDATMRERNRVRLQPTVKAVTEMEIAIFWPMQFLRHLPDVAAATNWVTFAHVIDRDCRWLARRRGGSAKTWRDRHLEGCEIIARGLRAARTPVW
jgi:hypothetical protein